MKTMVQGGNVKSIVDIKFSFEVGINTCDYMGVGRAKGRKRKPLDI